MSFTLFDTIAQAFFDLFGNSLLVPIIMIAVLSVILLTLRSGKVLLFLILTPLVTAAFVFGPQSRLLTNLGVDLMWVPVVMWVGLGILMFGVFVSIMR